jgi:uncharacterized membrane protein
VSAAAPTPQRPTALAILLIVAGVVGVWAAFALTQERFFSLANPGAPLSCDFSVIVQCNKNLESWQGSLFGFPNPIIGLVCWPVVVVVGVSLLAGSRFPRWYWGIFTLGMLFAFALIVFLSVQSIWEIHTLCPWCMVTWAVTIPAFWAVTFHNLRNGVFGRSRPLLAIGRLGSSWLLVVTLLCYLAIAVQAQVQFDIIRILF